MRTTSFFLTSILAGLTLLVPTARAADVPFAVITATGTIHHNLTRESAGLIYMRKLNYWEDGVRIQPVNLPPSHPVRISFSQNILGLAPDAMGDYWREMYFQGLLPPHVLASEAAVILFINSTPGAIGYVSTCIPQRGVYVALKIGDIPTCSN